MKEAFIKLHVSVLIAGATGIFGRLISLNEGLLVWYRMLFATVMFFLLLWMLGKLKRVSFRDVCKIGSVGMLLAIHWLFFYGSIKASNVSIGVVCLSLMSFFTALFEPLINRHRISLGEIACSLIGVLGIILIFHFDTRYRLGIGMGILSSALASLFTICNKKVSVGYTSSTMLMYEMGGGFLGLSCLLPLYLSFFPVASILPSLTDLVYLLLFASVCTVLLYILQIQVLKKISAFTFNLTYNLEPIYSIIAAMFLFHEAKELNASFYVGLGLILFSVLLHSAGVFLQSKSKPFFSLFVKWKH
ncbi:DMT family transporter [Phocaeicola acetigenes]|jgi:drug/metabolite transporter (DMT)-like permease|uniref:DMT family transporter n=1 Tax=Phocaeicola acetigenes TaxID=3016083 RepID=A0ABT4PFN1_9BACT|nr:DMT family transporter [Phocaeicola sp. KGMB11183]MCZ8371854.1 DMT family transporter [Phocaeicola sp. KGMB11183]